MPRIRGARFELYDLETDLGEKTDIAATHPDVYRDLKDRYVRWFERATKSRS